MKLNKYTYFLIVLLLGFTGLHKFLEKKWKIGFIYLFTAGLLGLGWIYDIGISFCALFRSSNEDKSASYSHSAIDIVSEKYMIHCSFDNKTCERCAKLDGKVFNYKDKIVGINFPPFHEGCRCWTSAVLEGYKHSKKSAKDKQGHSILIPSDMSYDEWKKEFID